MTPPTRTSPWWSATPPETRAEEERGRAFPLVGVRAGGRGRRPAPWERGRGRRTPDELLRDALAIRALLDDLGDDEHHVRIRLLVARDELRREAARQWRARGWRPITDRF